jgi:hypothetical protein
MPPKTKASPKPKPKPKATPSPKPKAKPSPKPKAKPSPKPKAKPSPKPAESAGSSSSPFFRPRRRDSDAAAEEPEAAAASKESASKLPACPKCSAGSGKLLGHKGRHLGATNEPRCAAAKPPVAAGKRLPKEPEKFQSYDTFAETASGKPSKLQAAKGIKKKTLKVGGGKMSLSLGGLKEALASATTAQIKAELARREGGKSTAKAKPAAKSKSGPEGKIHRVDPKFAS